MKTPRTRDVSGAVALRWSVCIGQPYSSLPHRLRAEPLAEGAKGERTFFDSLTEKTNLSLTSFCALCALQFFAAQAF